MTAGTQHTRKSATGHATCRAIVIERPRQAAWREIELAPRQPDSVIARTTMSAISSGTDMKTWRGEQHPDKLSYPCVPGYENIGIVEEPGAWAPEFKQGDRVMINEVRKFGNVCSAWGGNAEIAIKDSTSTGGNDPMAKIPDNVSDLEAVLGYLACVSLKGVAQTPIREGDTVLVVGAGLVGISAMQIVKILHPKTRVIAMERHPLRLEIARKFADAAILVDGTEEQRLCDLTDGKRADVIVECSGNLAVPGTLHRFLKDGGWTRHDRGGHIHLQGDYPGQLVFDDYHSWFVKNCTLSMTCAIHGEDKAQVLAWLSAGTLRLKDLPVEIWPVGKCREAYEYYEKKQGDVFKVIFDWREA